MQKSLSYQPTLLQEIIHLPLIITGPLNTPGHGTGKYLFPIHSAISWGTFTTSHVFWLLEWPEKIRRELVTEKNLMTASRI